MSEKVDMRERKVIACNLLVGTNVFPVGAKAYVILDNPGGGNDRILIIGRSRSGRWIEKWEDSRRLHNFRVKTLMECEPAYERASPVQMFREGWIDSMNERFGTATVVIATDASAARDEPPS